MSWSSLSEDLWRQIQQFVPLKDRLSSCSRVSRTLHRAAAAATQQVNLSVPFSGIAHPSLFQWMQHHGQHLASFGFCGKTRQESPIWALLTCPNLLELHLCRIAVQLGVSGQQPGVVHSCTQLTTLQLHDCSLLGSTLQIIGALSALPGLQHLELLGTVPEDEGVFEQGHPSTVLQHLQCLTHLQISCQRWLQEESLQHISCLTNLQELHITSPSARLCPSTTPGLSSLTALRKFSFHAGKLDPEILQDCTQLQELELIWVFPISAGDAAGLQLLGLVGRLQQLRCLRLKQLDNWPLAAAAAVAACVNLTASSKLEELDLDIDDLPPSIWQHIFPPDRQLTALQKLSVSCSDFWDPLEPPAAAALGTAAITLLANCCPKLRELYLNRQPGAQVTALTQLSALTKLGVVVPELVVVADTLEPFVALSGLSSLEHLWIKLAPRITPVDLLHLTALTALTALETPPAWASALSDDVSLEFFQVCTRVTETAGVGVHATGMTVSPETCLVQLVTLAVPLRGSLLG